MALDISNWGITVAGKTATSVTDILVSVLSEIPQVADIAGTTAYATIINVVPQMILNVVLFVVVFILLRLVSMVIYWIITGICFSKKKTEGKNKHRLLGSLVGVVQNFLIFLVILVPVVGTVNILGDIETITTQPATAAVSTASTNLLTATEEPPAETPVNNNQVSPYQTVNDVIDAYEASWVAKFLHGVKLDSACMYVFNELSTVTIDEQEYNLKIEANNITYIVMDVINLVELGELDLTSPDTIQALNKIIDSCYNSQLTSNLIDEVIPLATSKWLAGETFCGMSKPTVEGFSIMMHFHPDLVDMWELDPDPAVAPEAVAGDDPRIYASAEEGAPGNGGNHSKAYAGSTKVSGGVTYGYGILRFVDCSGHLQCNQQQRAHLLHGGGGRTHRCH